MTAPLLQARPGGLALLRKVPGNLYAILFLFVLFRMASAEFLTLSNLVNIVLQGSIMAIVSIGACLAIVSHGIDLSLGAIVGLSGGVAGLGMNAGYGIVPACLLAMASSAVFGGVNGIIIARTTVAPFIVTLGMMGVVEGVALVLARGSTVAAANATFKILGGGTIGILPIAALIAALCYGVADFLMRRSALGTHIYAIGGNEEAAALSGIGVSRIKVLVYTVNGLLAGLAGIILTSRLGAANPSQGIGIEFDGIAASVVGGTSLAGGRGSLWGTFGGAIIISILRNGLNMAGLPMALQMVILGLIIVAIVTLDSLRRQ